MMTIPGFGTLSELLMMSRISTTKHETTAVPPVDMDHGDEYPVGSYVGP